VFYRDKKPGLYPAFYYFFLLNNFIQTDCDAVSAQPAPLQRPAPGSKGCSWMHRNNSADVKRLQQARHLFAHAAGAG